MQVGMDNGHGIINQKGEPMNKLRYFDKTPILLAAPPILNLPLDNWSPFNQPTNRAMDLKPQPLIKHRHGGPVKTSSGGEGGVIEKLHYQKIRYIYRIPMTWHPEDKVRLSVSQYSTFVWGCISHYNKSTAMLPHCTYYYWLFVLFVFFFSGLTWFILHEQKNWHIYIYMLDD